MNGRRTQWFKENSVPLQRGDRTGKIVAYDPAFDCCLTEWEDGVTEMLLVGSFAPDYAKQVRVTAALHGRTIDGGGRALGAL